MRMSQPTSFLEAIREKILNSAVSNFDNVFGFFFQSSIFVVVHYPILQNNTFPTKGIVGLDLR